MTRVPLALLAGGAFAAAVSMMTPAFGQSDPNQPANDGSAAASMTVAPGQVAPGVDPGTHLANGNVNNAIASTQMTNATNQAQYSADVAAYDQAMRAHGHAVARQDSHYARQQQAYANAMEAWRIQDAACKHGNQKACNAPSPDPADFY